MNNENIVNSIKNLCKENNITVGQLEKEVKLSQGLVSKWINTNPSLDKIIDIADYFHVSLDEIVGRDGNNINSDFIKVLYIKTVNKEIQWNIFDKSIDESGIKQYFEDFSYYSFISQEDCDKFFESHKEKSYYFEYNNGYISIYAMYEYQNITNPQELKIFIQPDTQAELVEQHFEQSELLSLWLKVLISLDDQAPDEIRAEDLKRQFILGLKK